MVNGVDKNVEEIPIREGGEENFLGKEKMASKEKRFFILIIVVAIGTVVLGVLQFSKNLNSPFAEQKLAKQLGSTGASDLQNPNAALQKKDTDGDGLNNYDELFLYNTSSYIADSDSDGISDGTEVKLGTDPLCDEKKGECYIRATATNTDDTGTVQQEISSLSDLVQGLDSSALGSGGTNTGEAPLTPTELRGLLIQSGMSEKTVAGFTDEQLKAAYDKVVGGVAATNKADILADFTAEEKQQIISAIEKMSGSEVRNFLKSNGFSDDVLKQYDDETLKKTFLDLLKS